MEMTLRRQWLGDRAGFVCWARPAQTASAVEPAYREELRFLTEVFDAAPVPMIVMDPAGRVERMNSAAQELLGRSAVEVRSQFYWSEFLSDSAEAARARLQLEETPPSLSDPIEETWILAGGVTRRLRWRRSVIRSGGEVHHVVLTTVSPTVGSAAHAEPIVIDTQATAAVSDLNI